MKSLLSTSFFDLILFLQCSKREDHATPPLEAEEERPAIVGPTDRPDEYDLIDQKMMEVKVIESPLLKELFKNSSPFGAVDERPLYERLSEVDSFELQEEAPTPAEESP